MELDLASAMVAVEHMAGDGSFAGWYGAHVGIGSLPILYFGTEGRRSITCRSWPRWRCWARIA